MRESKKAKRERLAVAIDRLAQIYPTAECALEYEGDVWRLLVMGRLSAQCTDARVNIVCKELFAKYPDAKAMADAPVEEIERIVRPCGLFRMKAESIKAASAMIEYELAGQMPDTMEGLLRLPGVGRKTANVVYSVAFKGQAIAVDTHVFRVANRIGLVKADNSLKTENGLMKILDKNDWSRSHHYLIYLGRSFCKAKNPDCENCPILELCEKKIKR